MGCAPVHCGYKMTVLVKVFHFTLYMQCSICEVNYYESLRLFEFHEGICNMCRKPSRFWYTVNKRVNDYEGCCIECVSKACEERGWVRCTENTHSKNYHRIVPKCSETNFCKKGLDKERWMSIEFYSDYQDYKKCSTCSNTRFLFIELGVEDQKDFYCNACLLEQMELSGWERCTVDINGWRLSESVRYVFHREIEYVSRAKSARK